MRLIDAEALTDEIKENKKILQKGLGKDAEFAYISADSVLKTIYNQPTAYDPDKVVEKLKKDSYTETQNDMDPFDPSEVVNLESAIEIVEGGGVDG